MIRIAVDPGCTRIETAALGADGAILTRRRTASAAGCHKIAESIRESAGTARP